MSQKQYSNPYVLLMKMKDCFLLTFGLSWDFHPKPLCVWRSLEGKRRDVACAGFWDFLPEVCNR